jgi:hypothetical protein
MQNMADSAGASRGGSPQMTSDDHQETSDMWYTLTRVPVQINDEGIRGRLTVSLLLLLKVTINTIR